MNWTKSVSIQPATTSGGNIRACSAKAVCLRKDSLSTVGVGRAGMTKVKFGFHRGGGKHEPGPAAAYVQIYVKSSALS